MIDIHQTAKDDAIVPDSEIRTFYAQLGRRARVAREEAGVTQEELATRLGLTRASVANLEAGRQRISSYHLAVIASLLEVPIADLTPVPSIQSRTAVSGAAEDHLDLLQQLLAAAEVEDMDEPAHAAT